MSRKSRMSDYVTLRVINPPHIINTESSLVNTKTTNPPDIKSSKQRHKALILNNAH